MRAFSFVPTDMSERPNERPNERRQGVLSQWDDAKGFGFIAPDGGGSDGGNGAKLFVHAESFAARADRPRVGERLSFEVGANAQGRPHALKVRVLRAATVSAAPAMPLSSKASGGAVWLVPLFAAYYLVVHLLWPLPPAVWGAYMAMSLAAFIVYWGDKRAARRGQWRVPERTLHGLALACGWPGALLARQLLRHKSGKRAFARLFWLTVAANVALFTILATPLRVIGIEWLRAQL